jgi:hypothetical protein
MQETQGVTIQWLHWYLPGNGRSVSVWVQGENSRVNC